MFITRIDVNLKSHQTAILGFCHFTLFSVYVKGKGGGPMLDFQMYVKPDIISLNLCNSCRTN